jgi:hypothetical protein
MYKYLTANWLYGFKLKDGMGVCQHPSPTSLDPNYEITPWSAKFES